MGCPSDVPKESGGPDDTSPDIHDSYTPVDGSGIGMGMAVACRPGRVTWTVPAGGTVEESASWGQLRVQNYVQTVAFDYQNHSASTSFVVQ